VANHVGPTWTQQLTRAAPARLLRPCSVARGDGRRGGEWPARGGAEAAVKHCPCHRRPGPPRAPSPLSQAAGERDPHPRPPEPPSSTAPTPATAVPGRPRAPPPLSWAASERRPRPVPRHLLRTTAGGPAHHPSSRQELRAAPTACSAPRRWIRFAPAPARNLLLEERGRRSSTRDEAAAGEGGGARLRQFLPASSHARMPLDGRPAVLIRARDLRARRRAAAMASASAAAAAADAHRAHGADVDTAGAGERRAAVASAPPAALRPAARARTSAACLRRPHPRARAPCPA